MLRRACLLGLAAITLAARGQAQWTRFRGPNGSGIDAAPGYPAEFSPSRNVVWKTAVPYGQSSPVLAGGRIYLTAGEPARLLTICFDARTGRELWRRAIRREAPQKIFRANDPASPTPAADELGVYVFFPEFGLAAYSPDGRERWTERLGPFRNFYGMAASPVLAGGLVLLVCDQQTGSYVLALDRKTGRRRWKTERAGSSVGWATPMVFEPPEGEPELIVLGTTRLDSYYVATGERGWWMPLASMGALGTPVTSGDTLLVSTEGAKDPWLPPFADVLAKYDRDKDGRLSWDEFHNDPDAGEHFGWVDDNGDRFIDAREWEAARSLGQGDYGAVAIRPAGARGVLPQGAVRWRFTRNLPYIPAPLVYGGVYYMVRTGGIITSLSAATGEVLKQGRSAGALGEYYASPVAADGKIFLASDEGKVTVLKAGAQWEVLGVNDLAEEIHATPALSEGRIYVRTRGALYCFGRL